MNRTRSQGTKRQSEQSSNRKPLDSIRRLARLHLMRILGNMAANLIYAVCWNGTQTILGYSILVGHLKKRVCDVVPSHK